MITRVVCVLIVNVVAFGVFGHEIVAVESTTTAPITSLWPRTSKLTRMMYGEVSVAVQATESKHAEVVRATGVPRCATAAAAALLDEEKVCVIGCTYVNTPFGQYSIGCTRPYRNESDGGGGRVAWTSLLHVFDSDGSKTDEVELSRVGNIYAVRHVQHSESRFDDMLVVEHDLCFVSVYTVSPKGKLVELLWSYHQTQSGKPILVDLYSDGSLYAVCRASELINVRVHGDLYWNLGDDVLPADHGAVVVDLSDESAEPFMLLDELTLKW